MGEGRENQKSLLPLALEMIPKELREGHRVGHIIYFEPPFHQTSCLYLII